MNKLVTFPNVCDAILSWCSLLGCPRYWTSDNDSTFTSKVSSDLRKVLNLRDIQVPAYCPTTQGAVEVKVGELKRAVEKFLWHDNESLPCNSVLKAVIWGFNATVKYGTNLTPFEIMLGRKPYCPLGVCLTGYSRPEDGRLENESLGDYVKRMQERLQDIHLYWESKSQELRSRAIDQVNEPTPVYEPGQRCIRVAYINGRRTVLDTVEILERISEHGLYRVKTHSGQIVMCNGYQLVQLLRFSERENFGNDAPETNDNLRIVKRKLRQANAGVFVAVRKGANIFVGRTLAPYLNEALIEIQYMVPLDGEGQFRFPSSSEEREIYTAATEVADITLVPVRFEESATEGVFKIPRDQFGGCVVE